MKKEMKMKKGDFENYLYNKYGALGYRKHKEHTNEPNQFINLTLYYSIDTHIGTWVQGGRCFEIKQEKL